jgi:hypothetical protein
MTGKKTLRRWERKHSEDGKEDTQMTGKETLR